MLGRLRVEGAGGAALPRRARQVLGVLAARHDRLVTKDALADAVWGDDLPGNHVAALEQYVSLLRKAFQRPRVAKVINGLTGVALIAVAGKIALD